MITVEELKRLLSLLQPGDTLTAQTLANTGNIVVLRDGRYIGYIDMTHKVVHIESTEEDS